jgi:hypothetical protein
VAPSIVKRKAQAIAPANLTKDGLVARLNTTLTAKQNFANLQP